MNTILINKKTVNHQTIQLSGSSDFDLSINSIDLSENGFYEFISEKGFVLLCGMGREYCCIQFSHQNGKPPYEVAVTPTRCVQNQAFHYFIDDTCTEISSELCIPTNCAFDVIRYFLDHAEKTSEVEWQEI